MAKRDRKSEPCATEAPHPTTRSEAYSRAVHNAILLRGEWIAQAGFTDGMPIKIRVMPDCIAITTQNTGDLPVIKRGKGHFG